MHGIKQFVLTLSSQSRCRRSRKHTSLLSSCAHLKQKFIVPFGGFRWIRSAKCLTALMIFDRINLCNEVFSCSNARAPSAQHELQPLQLLPHLARTSSIHSNAECFIISVTRRRDPIRKHFYVHSMTKRIHCAVRVQSVYNRRLVTTLWMDLLSYLNTLIIGCNDALFYPCRLPHIHNIISRFMMAAMVLGFGTQAFMFNPPRCRPSHIYSFHSWFWMPDCVHVRIDRTLGGWWRWWWLKVNLNVSTVN